MNARGKLNVAYVNGALVLSAVVGMWLQSWLAFLATLAVLLGGQMASGGIRFKGRT